METLGVTANAGIATQSVGGDRGLDRITGQDFMTILVKQLQYQDPLEPMGNEEMINQISSIRELEMNTRLTDKLERLTDEQRFGSAAALIGRMVRGAVTDSEGTEYEVAGVVEAVRFTANGEAMLELDTGETLPLAKLTEVTDPE